MRDFEKIRLFLHGCITTKRFNSDIKVPTSLLGITNWNETHTKHFARNRSMSRKVI